jgi:hypothetical protein
LKQPKGRPAFIIERNEGSNFQRLESGKSAASGTCLKSRHEKLLDDAGQLLYCDPEFDRQFVISLS